MYTSAPEWPEQPTGDDERESVAIRQLTWRMAPGLHLRREFDPWTYDELVDSLGEADDIEARARAVLRLGLAAPATVDRSIFRVLDGELRSTEDPLRQVALWSITYSPWPAYLSTLHELADHDPNKSIRERARMVLDGLDAVGGTS
ncbi:hypothetical protein AB0H12_36530 [Actinosynnema sp. NPDC023794]